MTRPALLVVGPVPPPHHGLSIYVRMLLDSPVLGARWRVSHLDTSDRRSLANLGRFDLTNVRLGLSHARELARRVRRERPDVVWIPLSQNGPAYLRDALFVALADMAGARVVGHLHGGWFHEFHRTAPPPLRWAIRASLRRLAAVWVLGEGLRKCFAGLMPPTRVHVVPNGVPDPLAARAPAEPGPFTVLYLGQLSTPKGVADLIEAFTALSAAAGAATRLVLAGGWVTDTDEAHIRALLARSPAAGRIELAGVVEGAAKDRLLAEAHVLVLAARAPEGQPLVILEAMAAGIPTIATARGAIGDMVEDGVTGLVVPEADPLALAGALDRLRRDPDLRAQLGRNARASWAHQFTAERAMARVADALDDVMRERRADVPRSLAPAVDRRAGVSAP